VRQRLQQGVARSQLLLLHHELADLVTEDCLHLVTTVTDNDDGAAAWQGSGGIEYMAYQRFARQRMQYLGQGRAHAGTLTRCKNHHIDVSSHAKLLGLKLCLESAEMAERGGTCW
jgi:hypothetical protein